MLKNVIALVVFFSAVSSVGCSDSQPSNGPNDGAGGAGGHPATTDGGQAADGTGSDGGPASCWAGGCWDGRRCVLPADQTLEVQGADGTECRPTPLNCTGQQSAPCPTNTAPAVALAWRGRVAYCCPANVCTLDACSRAP